MMHLETRGTQGAAATGASAANTTSSSPSGPAASPAGERSRRVDAPARPSLPRTIGRHAAVVLVPALLAFAGTRLLTQAVDRHSGQGGVEASSDADAHATPWPLPRVWPFEGVDRSSDPTLEAAAGGAVEATVTVGPETGEGGAGTEAEEDEVIFDAGYFRDGDDEPGPELNWQVRPLTPPRSIVVGAWDAPTTAPIRQAAFSAENGGRHHHLQATAEAVAVAMAASLGDGSATWFVQPEKGQSASSDATPEPSAADADPDHLVRETRIPLESGRIEFGTMLGNLMTALGFEPATVNQVRATLGNADFDVNGFVGRGQLRLIEAATRQVVEFESTAEELVVRVDVLRLREERNAIHASIRDTIGRWFPGAADAMETRYGLYLQTTPDTMRPLDAEDDPAAVNMLLTQTAQRQRGDGSSGARTVVLVHGLDDPGIIWNDLIPHLLGAGHTVLRFEYPNDQPISDSAALFAEELSRLRLAGVDNLSIVAHSMGSLVAREVLTNPVWYAGQASWGGAREQLPSVDRFIMVGPPNHGASLANLRFVAELRDIAVRSISGPEDGFLFNGFFDGAGEAKIDLLPESAFLQELNARPLPQGVQMTIIAGRVSPVDEAEVTALLERLRQSEHAGDEAPTTAPASGSTSTSTSASASSPAASSSPPMTAEDGGSVFGLNIDPQAWNEHLDNLETGLLGIIGGMGDGAVSLASTHLEGVSDVVVVEANHFGMLRNVIPGIDRVPPAIPVILSRLERSGEGGGAAGGRRN